MKNVFMAAFTALTLFAITDLHAAGLGCHMGDKACEARLPKYPPDSKRPNGRAPNGCYMDECVAKKERPNGRAPNGCYMDECLAMKDRYGKGHDPHGKWR